MERYVPKRYLPWKGMKLTLTRMLIALKSFLLETEKYLRLILQLELETYIVRFGLIRGFY